MLYFAADDGVNGQELWKSDGTQAGTVLLADIDPSPNADSFPTGWWATTGCCTSPPTTGCTARSSGRATHRKWDGARGGRQRRGGELGAARDGEDGKRVYFAARSQNYGTEVWDSLPEPSGQLGLVSGAALLAWLRKRRQQS